MRYLTVKRNKNGEPNKTDMKSLGKNSLQVKMWENMQIMTVIYLLSKKQETPVKNLSDIHLK